VRCLQFALLLLLSSILQYLAIYASAFVIVFCDFQDGELSGHDSPRAAAWYDEVFGEVCNSLFAKKVFVEVDQTIDFGGRRVDHGEDSIGVDCLPHC
jgi:hypothetical protein